MSPLSLCKKLRHCAPEVRQKVRQWATEPTNMNLDKNYRIIADDDNFILQRKLQLRGKKRNERSKAWQNIGFWKDLGQALQAYSNGVKRASLPTTLEELLQLQHAHSTQIRRIGERCVSLWGKN